LANAESFILKRFLHDRAVDSEIKGCSHLKVDIRRSDGIHSYDVPLGDKAVNIMQVLDYIYTNLDHSLAYFRHSACCQGICGRCLVRADGKNVLACVAKVEPGTDLLTLEPAGSKVVRDLVIQL